MNIGREIERIRVEPIEDPFAPPPVKEPAPTLEPDDEPVLVP